MADTAYWAALDEAIDPADAGRRLRKLVAELERQYPSAAACLAEDLPALCIHLNYFPRLRKRFRSSKLLERSLEEVKRRTKVIGRFPGETSCLSMCWAVLDLFLAGARGLGLSDLEYKQVGPMSAGPPTAAGDSTWAVMRSRADKPRKASNFVMPPKARDAYRADDLHLLGWQHDLPHMRCQSENVS